MADYTQDQKLMQIHTVDIYGGIYSESTEPIDAVKYFASSEIRTHDLDNSA